MVGIDVDSDGNYDEGGSAGGKLMFMINEDIPDLDSCTLSLDDAFFAAMDSLSMAVTLVTEKESYEEIYADTNNKAHLVWKVILLASNDTENSINQHLFRIDRCTNELLQHTIRQGSYANHKKQNSDKSIARFKRFAAAMEEISENERSGFNVRQDDFEYETGPTMSWTEIITDVTDAPTNPTVKPPTQSPTTQSPTTKKVTTPKPNGTCKINIGGFGGNLKSGKYTYGVAPRCLNLKKEGDKCTLENEFVKVVDMKTDADENKKDAVTYSCNEIYKDKVNGAYSPVLDAFFHGTQTYQMLKDWYNYTPLKTARYLMVHFKKQWANAMLSPNGNLLFGDGDSETYPLVTQDTVAHEAGHGITQDTSQLAYEEQSGGTDEAFCDIMGETAEAYHGKNDWLSGFYDAKDPKAALRYFVDPTKDGNSIMHVKDYQPGIDVHLSSGIINHMFYQLVKVQKIPIRYAFEAVLTANRIYWREKSDFEDVACGVLRAALDHGLDIQKFRSAFKAVGINGCSLTKYLIQVTPSKPRNNVKVSSIRNPIFLVTVPKTAKTITVSVTASKAVGINLSRTVNFITSEAKGTNTVNYTLTGIKFLYIQLGNKNQPSTTGTLTIKYT